jgi:hypothetical protein
MSVFLKNQQPTLRPASIRTLVEPDRLLTGSDLDPLIEINGRGNRTGARTLDLLQRLAPKNETLAAETPPRRQLGTARTLIKLAVNSKTLEWHSFWLTVSVVRSFVSDGGH